MCSIKKDLVGGRAVEIIVNSELVRGLMNKASCISAGEKQGKKYEGFSCEQSLFFLISPLQRPGPRSGQWKGGDFNRFSHHFFPASSSDSRLYIFSDPFSDLCALSRAFSFQLPPSRPPSTYSTPCSHISPPFVISMLKSGKLRNPLRGSILFPC